MPLAPLTGTLGKKRAAHLLRRTCCGGTLAETDTFAALTPAQAVERLFDDTLPDPPLPIDPLTENEWITNGGAESEEFQLNRYFRAWHLGQMLGGSATGVQKLPYIFRERLVFFLHTHFTTKISTVNNSRATYFQQALFRFFAFDENDATVPSGDPMVPDTTVPKNIKALTKKLCVDNAMLFFLDGRLNVKGSPNENFARELLELYSIGRGLEGNIPDPEFVGDYFYFTEEDVQAGARVLSGFNVDRNFTNIDEDTGLPRGAVRGSANFATAHEAGVKTFSQRMGNGTVTPDVSLLNNGNATEESILDEISQLIDLIYAQPQTARHICRKLYRFFVYHQISPALEDDIVDDMASILTANDFKLQPVLEALFTSTHFYEGDPGEDDNSYGSIIKSPIEVTLGTMRTFEISLPDYTIQTDTYYERAIGLLEEIKLQGMDYYEPFEVAGYSAYHQFPIFNRNWITTNYLTNRYNYIRRTLTNGDDMEAGQVDIFQFVVDHFAPATIRIANDLIIEIASYFLPSAENLGFAPSATSELTSERLNYFKSAMFAFAIDTDPEGTWTVRWDNNLDRESRANQLEALFDAMLQTPEYQLM